MQHQIFLSYCRSDAALAEAFYRAATARNINVWWDQLIPPGRDWRESIVQALGQSASLLILFSRHSNQSRQLIKELSIADRQHKPVIPVLIDDVEPTGAYLYEMASRNWINLYPDPMSRIDALVEQIAGELDLERGSEQTAPARTTATVMASQPAEAPAAPAPPPPVAREAELAGPPPATRLPVRLTDAYILLPVLAIVFALGVTQDFTIGTVKAPGLNLLILMAYMIIVAVRCARLNISIFSPVSFATYLGIGLLVLPSALLLDWVKGIKQDYGSITLGLALSAVIVAVGANILQFILRKIFQRNLFRSRLGGPLQASRS